MSTDRALSPTQQQVLGLILAGSTARAAAETAGVHRNTVANWLCSAEFRQALAYAQYEKAIFFREQAESLATDAHNAIRAMLADAAIPANVRLNAALAMIDRAGAAMPPLPEEPAPMPAIVHKKAQISAQVPAELQSEPNSALPGAPFLDGKIGRNEVCPCGSGMKFKRCCLGKTAPAALHPPAPSDDA